MRGERLMMHALFRPYESMRTGNSFEGGSDELVCRT